MQISYEMVSNAHVHQLTVSLYGHHTPCADVGWVGGQTVKNLRRLACKFDLDQSERKSSQVNASARKAWPNGVTSRPRFSTCV